MDPHRSEITADLAHHLKGLQFPLKRQDMIRHARLQGADPHMMYQLSRLQDKEYGSMIEVLRELGQTG